MDAEEVEGKNIRSKTIASPIALALSLRVFVLGQNQIASRIRTCFQSLVAIGIQTHSHCEASNTHILNGIAEKERY